MKEKYYITINTGLNAIYPIFFWPLLTINVEEKILDELSFALVLFAFSNIFLDLGTLNITSHKYSRGSILTKKNITVTVIFSKLIISIVYVLVVFSITKFDSIASEIILFAIIIHSQNNLWIFIANSTMKKYFIVNFLSKCLITTVILLNEQNILLIYSSGIFVTELNLSMLFFLTHELKLRKINIKIVQITLIDGLKQILASLSVAQYRNIPLLILPYLRVPDGYYSTFFIIEKMARAPSMITVPLNQRNLTVFKGQGKSYLDYFKNGKDLLLISLTFVLTLNIFQPKLFEYFNILNTQINIETLRFLSILILVSTLTTILGQNVYIIRKQYHKFTKHLSRSAIIISLFLTIAIIYDPTLIRLYIPLCEISIMLLILYKTFNKFGIFTINSRR